MFKDKEIKDIHVKPLVVCFTLRNSKTLVVHISVFAHYFKWLVKGQGS